MCWWHNVQCLCLTKTEIAVRGCVFCLHVYSQLYFQWNKQGVVCYRCMSCSQIPSSPLQAVKALLVLGTLRMPPSAQALCNVAESDFMLCLSLQICSLPLQNSDTCSACYCFSSLIKISKKFERLWGDQQTNKWILPLPCIIWMKYKPCLLKKTGWKKKKSCLVTHETATMVTL